MNILTVENMTKAYGERKLFSNASFFLEEGEKAGIIGINGTGKSTLLKIIAGLEEPDEGRVIMANHCMVRFLPQNPRFGEKETVLEAVLRGNTKEENESTIVADAKAMLTRLGVTDFDEPCGQLSGGQRKRLALVSVLLSPAEILVLDEPTNHLDNDMSAWLESTLKKRKGAVIMVTHDRYFLDSVTTRILEIDKGSIYSYDANYAGYLELKMQREEMALASQRKRASILRNELAWVQRGARARSTKQKARLERYEELKNTPDVVTDKQVEISSASSRLGRTVVELENVSKAYGGKVLIKDFTCFLGKNDRIGFVGPNGSGKSTLIKLINGLLVPSSGQIFICGQAPGPETKAIVSYLPERTYLPDTVRVKGLLSFFRDFYTDFDAAKAEEMLQKLDIDPSSPLKTLSKGTREKVQLIMVMSRRARVYILDEPIAGVDPAARDYILKTIIQDYSEDASILLSTHLIADVEQLLDDVIFLKDGQIILSSSVEKIRDTRHQSVDSYFREVFSCSQN